MCRLIVSHHVHFPRTPFPSLLRLLFTMNKFSPAAANRYAPLKQCPNRGSFLFCTSSNIFISAHFYWHLMRLSIEHPPNHLIPSQFFPYPTSQTLLTFLFLIVWTVRPLPRLWTLQRNILKIGKMHLANLFSPDSYLACWTALSFSC